jgi:hypothetical protein
MQITSRTNRGYWGTVALGVAIGIVYLIGFVVSIAGGGTGWPYDMIGFVGGLAYVAGVIYFRARG